MVAPLDVIGCQYRSIEFDRQSNPGATPVMAAKDSYGAGLITRTGGIMQLLNRKILRASLALPIN